MQIGTWCTKSFEISDAVVRSFEKFSMGVELETKTKTSGKQEYKVRKKTKARTISIEVTLHAFLGVDVEMEVLEWLQLSHDGMRGKFYIGGRSMGPCTFLLTSAKTSETEFSPGGRMIYAKMALSFEQSSKNNTTTKGRRVSSVFNILQTAKAQSKALKTI